MKFLVALALVAGCMADLRMASQPRNDYKTISRSGTRTMRYVLPDGSTQTKTEPVATATRQPFAAPLALYMEPSAFDYGQLENQRNNNYDNFLRSNIDNEQDNRNFNTEAGKDHLPFRSFEGAPSDLAALNVPGAPAIQTKLDGQNIVATPGVPYEIPLRWNNPHASELEVNVWITKNDPEVVIPIKKPTCSGEGHQDNVFLFTIPSDFNNLGTKIPNFTGCKAVGDCVLQIYAHSVETRMYSMGTPLIVEGNVPPATAQNRNAINPVPKEVGTDLSKLELDICRPSSDPAANINLAIPQEPRYISDVANHAFQNSDYSPYAGQQPLGISRNLQAAAILKMTTGNRGELGKSVLAQNKAAQAFQQNLANQVDNLIKRYEGITNNIIGRVGNQNIVNGGDVLAAANVASNAPNPQMTAKCFRCDNVGAVTANRLTTNTYVPSFEIPAANVAAAENLVPDQYRNILKKNADGTATLQLYEGVLQTMSAALAEGSTKYGLEYLPAVVKEGPETMKSATGFRKVNANGRNDNGVYATQQFLARPQLAAMEVKESPVVAPTGAFVFETEALMAENFEFAPLEEGQVPAEGMYEDVYDCGDSDCDDDSKAPDANSKLTDADASTCTVKCTAKAVEPAVNLGGGLSAAPANTANLPLAFAAAAIAAGAALVF